ncbi:MAG TPA: cache domain-containing protein [Anaeromyxobacteraceae bacterium]
MTKIHRALLLAAVLLAIPGAALAAQRASTSGRAGSKQEARAMVDKAARWVKEHGREQTLAEISRAGTSKSGAFIDGDLYIFAYDFRGVCVAHGAIPKLVGRNMWDLEDVDGRYLIRGLAETARKGSGWYAYKWSNPLTKKIEDKLAYVMRIDDELWLGSGVYGTQAR